MKPNIGYFGTNLIVSLGLVLLCTASFAQTPTSKKMPPVKAETLAEREVTLPQDLPGEKTLILMAFEQAQQKNVNTWVAGMNLADNPIPWIETPVIDPKNRLFRAFIQGGMRRGIPEQKDRERTITLFTDRAALMVAMGLPEQFNTIYAVVVDRAGNVLLNLEGDYSAEKALLIKNALK
jgi:hypothetical protein